MKFFPSQSLTIYTKLSTNQILEILSSNLIVNSGAFKTYKKLFKGSISNRSFILLRVFSYRNSFQAEINGKIESINNGTAIELNLQLRSGVKAFMSFWCFFVFIAQIILIISSFFNPKIALGCLIPIGMLLYSYTMITFYFNADCRESIKIIKRLLEAE